MKWMRKNYELNSLERAVSKLLDLEGKEEFLKRDIWKAKEEVERWREKVKKIGKK